MELGKIKPSNIRFREIRPGEINPSNIRFRGIRPGEIKLCDVKSRGLGKLRLFAVDHVGETKTRKPNSVPQRLSPVTKMFVLPLC